MINLLNSKSKLKPECVISNKDCSAICSLVPENKRTDFTRSLRNYFSKYKDELPVYIFKNPDHFQNIITLRNIDIRYDDDYLPNYIFTSHDEVSVIYSESLISFGTTKRIIRSTTVVSNDVGGHFDLDKIYLIRIDTMTSFQTTRVDIKNSSQSNIYMYIPKSIYRNL